MVIAETISNVLQVISGLIALLICYYAYKSYKITANKTHIYFSLAFLLLGLNLIINSPFILIQTFNVFYIFSYLLSYALLIIVYSKVEQRKSLVGIIILLTLILSIYASLAYKSYVTETIVGLSITNFILTTVIVFFAYHKYTQRKNLNLMIIIIGFVLFAVSHALTIFSNFGVIFSLLTQITQFIGFICILKVTKR